MRLLVLLLAIKAFLFSNVVHSQTLEELKARVKSLKACQISLQEPECNLSILDKDIQQTLIQIDKLKKQSRTSTQGASSNYSGSKTKYPIEYSINDEKFIINGELFEARTFCFNMNEGDDVIFLEGSAYGACVSAELLNLNTGNECEVWCE